MIPDFTGLELGPAIGHERRRRRGPTIRERNNDRGSRRRNPDGHEARSLSA